MVGGRTLLDHNLDQLAGAGIEEAIVNVHYLPDQIIAHLATRERPAITISDEREQLLDSGGGIARVLDRFDGKPFFTLNADTIWLDGPVSNLARLQDVFDPAMMDVLLLVAPVATTIGWGNRGDFHLAQDGRLTRASKHDIAAFAYTGVGILKPAAFVGKPAIFSLNQIFDEAAAAQRLYGLRLDGIFMHVGTPEALREAEIALLHHGR